MSAYTIDPTLIDWRNANGKRVKATVNRSGVLVFRPFVRDLKDFVRWASGKSNYYISKLLNQFWNTTSFSFPSPLYWALWTTTLTAASTGSTGTEASYTGYARVSSTPNSTNYSTSSAGSSVTNNVAVTWPANAGSLNTITYVAVLDASTTGNILFWGSITSTAINPGDTPQLGASSLTASEA